MINKIANKLLFIFTGTDLNHQIKVWNDLKYDSDVSIANKDSKIKDLEYEIQNLSNLTLERNTLQSQLDETNKENAELNKRISSIQVYLEDIQKQKEHLINNFNGFEIAKNNEISDLTTKIENLEGQISRTQEVFEKDKLDYIREKQLMIDNNHQLTIEIDNLTEKIKYRDQTNVDLRVERDNLKTQLKKCLDELALLNNKEQEQQLQEEDNQQQKQREEKVKKIINAGIKLGEAANSESETETKADNTILKYEGLLEIELDYVFENINSHNGFIKWIFDAENNKYFQVLPAFFKQEDFVLVDLRRRLEDYCTNHQGKPKFVCAICYEPIKLSGNHGERGKVNCFVHSHDNINCPIITGSNRNVNVRLFAESRQYQFSASLYSSKIIRKQLAIFLQNTPNIANYTAEPIISYNFNFAVWRKPHFSCEYKGHHIAFEVQTNPSTIKVVTSRNLFYRKQNSFILWIFDDSFASSKSLSLKDIFYANNHNIFVFDKIAQEKSESTNELWLKCIWEEPYIDENTISWEKKSDYITLDQLTYDSDNYIAYYYPSAEKYINLGGKVSYQVNLNNNSFDEYEDTFEDLQKSNFERLKAKVLLSNIGQNENQDIDRFNEDDWIETDDKDDKNSVNFFEYKDENDFQIADLKVSENRNLFRKYLHLKGYNEALISEYIKILSGQIADEINLNLVQKSFHFFSIKDKSFLQLLFDYLFSLDVFIKLDNIENYKYSKAFDEYLQYRTLQKSTEKKGRISTNKYSSILIYITDNKRYGIRALPLSYKDEWKVNDRIRSKDGSEGCTIKYISSRSDYEIEEIENVIQKIKCVSVHNQEPKSLFRLRPSLNNIMKILNSSLETEQGKRFLIANNCLQSDFDTKNTIKCFTTLVVNGKNLSCKIIKKNENNALTLDFLSKYMESEIKNVDLKFSILDKNFTYKFENGEFILNKNGTEYTLKVLISISYDDILSRIPKLINERRK